MAHYAFLDDNNIVTEVIVGRNEDEVVDGISDWEAHYGEFRGQTCKRTSYNGNIRGKYAAIGDLYNEEEDIFISPKPSESWVRNGSFWNPPIPMPTEGGPWMWVETDLNWQIVPTE
jgi:hypothetical protein